MSRLTVVRDWYTGRSLRERWLIAIMLAIAVPMLAFFLLYRPLVNSIDQAQQRHVAAVRNHGLVLARIAQLDAVQRPSAAVAASGSAPLSLQITEAAAQAGVSLSANEPRGDASTLITLAPAAPTAALRWLRQLEGRGIIVRELAITPQAGGQIVATATLSRSGAQ